MQCTCHVVQVCSLLVSVYLCADEYFYYWHGWDLQYKWIRELYQNTSLVDRQPEAIWRGRVADDDYPERDALRSAQSSSLLHYSLHYSLLRNKTIITCTTCHYVAGCCTLRAIRVAEKGGSVLCRRAYQKCPAQLSKQGRADDAALINQRFDVDQISDNCRFRLAPLVLP